jgi:HSP20 family protein
MAIVRFDPFLTQSWVKPFLGWEDEERWPAEYKTAGGLNIYEEDGNMVVEAPLPGVSEEEVDVTYKDGVLCITGRHEEKKEEKKKRAIHKWQMASSFSYTTSLPRPVEAGKIEAVLKNGVLKVVAPVAEAAKEKRIPVKAGAKQ